ncbi:MAG: hypothetical protein FWH15_08225 [Betaproteobacteria bacterium]|nr:hypothetical protein [Betaproteobacteria bacterium]
MNIGYLPAINIPHFGESIEGLLARAVMFNHAEETLDDIFNKLAARSRLLWLSA